MFKKLLIIGSGFFLGQGVAFSGYTYLLLSNEIEFISQAIVTLSLLSLFQWAADAGGIYFLKKEYYVVNFLSLVIFRLLFSIAFVFLIGLLLNEFTNDMYSLNEYLGFIIVSTIWSFNLTGLTDESDKLNILGPLTNFCWTTSSLALFFPYQFGTVGFVIFFYILGLFFSVFIQYYFLWSKIYKSSRLRITLIDFKKVIYDSISFNFSYLVAQGYSRFVNVIVEQFLLTSVASLFLYARTAVNVVSQFVMFSRRLEFKRLATESSKQQSIKNIFLHQKITFFLLVLSFTFIVISWSIVSFLFEYIVIENILFYAILLSLNQLIWFFPSSYSQYLLASDKLKLYVLINIISAISSVVFIILFPKSVSTIIIGEILMYLVQVLLIIGMMKNDKNLSLK